MAVLTLSDEYIRATCRELEEKPRRLFLGRLAMEYGYGGISAVAKIALVCRQMVSRGVKELKEGVSHTQGERNRKPGGGRKTSEETHRINMEKKAETEPVTEINADLLKLVNSIAEEYTYGDPVEGRVYCSLTMAVIRDEVRKESGQTYSETTIRRIMKKLNYTRLKNQKFNQVGDKHLLKFFENVTFCDKTPIPSQSSFYRIPAQQCYSTVILTMGPHTSRRASRRAVKGRIIPSLKCQCMHVCPLSRAFAA